MIFEYAILRKQGLNILELQKLKNTISYHGRHNNLTSRNMYKIWPKTFVFIQACGSKKYSFARSSNNGYILVGPKLCTLTNDKKLWPLDM